ncbi:DUF6777 domain-containing protein [Actinomycetospora sp. CA-101289]|uniref:DUF6777 domain-containing protein n=1 Tax=Actinomycetospora sp. CA-101289 TaxID=3239893 RepID=UPI003D988EA6
MLVPPPYVVQVPPPRRTPVAAIVLLVVLAILVAALAGMLVAREMAAPTGVALEPVATTGANPFMTGAGSDAVGVRPVAHTGGRYTGTTPGLFGGTGDDAACDRSALVRYLGQHPDRASGWASVLGLRDGSSTTISRYVDGLTSVVLRSDTYVTNHGWSGGHVTAWPAVLQAGTAVLVDPYGNPVTRCFCGNPLTAPQSFSSVAYVGPRWSSFRSTTISVIQHQTTNVTNEYTVVDVHTGEASDRPRGTEGEEDATSTATVSPDFPAPEAPATELGDESTDTVEDTTTSTDPALVPGLVPSDGVPGSTTTSAPTVPEVSGVPDNTGASTSTTTTTSTTAADLEGSWTASPGCDLGPSSEMVFDGTGSVSVGTGTATAGSYALSGSELVLSPSGGSVITFAPDDSTGTAWTDTAAPSCTLTRGTA